MDTGVEDGQSDFVLMPRFAPRRVWLIATFACLAGCTSDATTGPAPSVAGETSTVVPLTTTAFSTELSESDLAEILAVVVPAAITADPDGSTEIRVRRPT